MKAKKFLRFTVLRLVHEEYFKVLEDDGRFLYKSASLADLKAVFFTAFLKGGEAIRRPNVSGDPLLRIELGAIDKLMTCKSAIDEKLYQEIATNIRQIGDRYELKENEFTADSMHHSLDGDSRLSIKSQVFLLQRAGFKNIRVAFAEFKDWGYSLLPSQAGVYSILISGRKPSSK